MDIRAKTTTRFIPFKILRPTKEGNFHHSEASSSASKFKGIVCQSNGHWGAQIYANHHRVWLGTFHTEKEAAMAYDSAAIKLRNGSMHRNFPWTPTALREPQFQSQFNTETVLSMIKDGSYFDKFSDYLSNNVQNSGLTTVYGPRPNIELRHLFQKELTPSDVSKLNRLVVPKKYALKYFPRIDGVVENNGGSVDDIELVFFDRSMRSWEFRYCYWKSSQSFVFTRGWSGFVREKGLREKDTIIFSSYYDGRNELGLKVFVIDVAYNYNPTVERDRNEAPTNANESEDDGGNAEQEGFKLFGVQII